MVFQTDRRQITPRAGFTPFRDCWRWNLKVLKSVIVAPGKTKVAVRKSLTGFTFIELLVVVFITAMLATVVTANFRQLRISQEIQAGVRDLVSNIRDAQNNVLTGKRVNATQSARAYVLNFTPGVNSYSLRYNVFDGDGNNATSAVQTIMLKQNMQIQQLLVAGNPESSAEVRLESPFAKFSVNGGTSQLQINLLHTVGNRTRSVIINSISGRIEDQ